jgi:CheY-like chemotaxis protein
MTTHQPVRALQVLVIESDPRAALATSAALHSRGHRALRVARPSWASTVQHADVALIPIDLPDGDGLECARVLAARLPVVMTGAAASTAQCVQAMRAGVRDFVARPCSAEELCAALERSAAPARSRREHSFSTHVTTDLQAAERAVRELCAWALAQGLGPTARARICSAAHELLDNAIRHGYAGTSGVALLRARIENDVLELSVLDHGRGFDATAVLAAEGALEGRAAASGLARCAALCEDLRCHSTANGTLVELRFELASVLFAEDAYSALSERDWLTPREAATALRMTRAGRAGDALHLSPAMAVTLGRLLAGGTAERLRQAALWSA